MQYLGTYHGQVVSNRDPLQLGRVQVRVPTVHGLANSPFSVVDDVNLPWCLPAGLPAGGSIETGGVSWIPNGGDQVWVRFLDGELEKPVWEWGNQSTAQKTGFGGLPYHAYLEDGSPARRSAATRFQHWTEILPTGIKEWSRNLYTFEIYDPTQAGKGRISWTTALGYLLMIDDSTKTMTGFAENIEMTAKQSAWTAHQQFSLTTPTLNLGVGNIIVGGTYSGPFNLDAVSETSKGARMAFNHLGLEVSNVWTISCPAIYLTTGALSYGKNGAVAAPSDSSIGMVGDEVTLGRGARDPLVRMSDLQKALKEVQDYLKTHTHQTPVPDQVPQFNTYGSGKVSCEITSQVSKPVV